MCLLSLHPGQPRSTTSSISFLTLEYYQGFYDVTTAQVHLPLTSPIVISSLGGTAVVGRDGTTEYNLADPGSIRLCMTLLPSVETLSKCHMCLSVLLSIHTPHKGSSLIPMQALSSKTRREPGDEAIKEGATTWKLGVGTPVLPIT